MKLLQTFLLIVSLLDFSIGLPVTSKPIENTPEHLAWEAWIMIPPTQNKTRKITPKSIFILPNKTTTPVINCPPGHLIENSKCIQTVQIDRDSILLNHLANVLNNTTYDFDYDYEEYEEPHKLVAETSNRVPDYNDGPLKIPLLDPGSIPVDIKNVNEYGISEEEDEFNPKPFRDEESSSTTSSTTTSTESLQSNRIPDFITEPVFTATTGSPKTTAATLSESSIAEATKDPASGTTPTTTASSTTTTAESPTTTSSSSSTDLDENLPSTAESLPVLASESTELPSSSGISLTGTSSDAIVFPDDGTDDITVSGEEYDFLKEDDTKDITTGFDDETFDSVTSPDYKSTDIQEEPSRKPILISVTRTVIDDKSQYKDNEQSTSTIKEEKPTTVKWPPAETTIAPILVDTKPTTTINPTRPQDSTFSQLSSENAKPTHSFFPTKDYEEASVHLHTGPESTLENNEHSNRFVYQHIEPVPSTQIPARPNRAPSGVQEQLRMINKIVEENKRRADLETKIRFPSDTFIQTDNLRADFIRFPEPTASRPPAPTLPTRILTESRVAPIQHQPTIFTPTTSLKTVSNPSTTMTTQHQNPKPFWWLPSGWEVDRDGDKPLLLRFWSRSSPTSSTYSSTTTGFRENSRRPTDNLYREISAQEFYNVLNTRNSRHYNANEFT